MIEIAGRQFGPGNPLIVAELSCNHSGSYELALELIREAKKAGADAVKFQAYTAGEMAPREGPALTKGPWVGRTLWELYDEAKTPYEWFPELFKSARELDLIPFSSVFSIAGIEFLEKLDCPAYKIASAEAMCPELLGAISRTLKPWMFSDGCVDWRKIGGFGPMPIVMRCVSDYPAHANDYAFVDLWGDPERLGQLGWGLSDHSMDTVTWTTAAALGASVIEAHLRLYPSAYPDGPPLDAGHSLFPASFATCVKFARQAARMAYADREPPEPAEFQRRLLWATDLPSGTKVLEEHVTCLRAPEGAEPSSVGEVLGKRLHEAVTRWSAVSDGQVS